MPSYIYKNENGVHNIYVEGYEEKPIRTLPNEELAILWCQDMTISYDLGWEHGCQLGHYYEEEE